MWTTGIGRSSTSTPTSSTRKRSTCSTSRSRSRLAWLQVEVTQSNDEALCKLGSGCVRGHARPCRRGGRTHRSGSTWQERGGPCADRRPVASQRARGPARQRSRRESRHRARTYRLVCSETRPGPLESGTETLHSRLHPPIEPGCTASSSSLRRHARSAPSTGQYNDASPSESTRLLMRPVHRASRSYAERRAAIACGQAIIESSTRSRMTCCSSS